MSKTLPLAGVRVIEFVHMVMGPACGLVLGDLGAEVIKVEPVEGDNIRRLTGAGAGFWVTYNRNKKSLALDLKSPEGRPSRAGASVNDIIGGMFGDISILAALHERNSTGRGQFVRSALFENDVFLVAQHMMQYVLTGKPAAPMPRRRRKPTA